MLENKCHLVLVLCLSKNPCTLWNSSILIVNLLISFGNFLSSFLDCFLNFLLNLSQLSIIFLNFQCFLQLIDLWNLGENLVCLLLHLVDLGDVNLHHVVLVEHGLHLLLDALTLLLQVLLQGVDALLDGAEL